MSLQELHKYDKAHCRWKEDWGNFCLRDEGG